MFGICDLCACTKKIFSSFLKHKADDIQIVFSYQQIL